jgi:hypothetical protein
MARAGLGRRIRRCRAACPGEVVAAGEGEGVGLVRAEDTFAVGDGGLEQGEGVGEPPGGLVDEGEVVAAGEGVRVVGAEDAFAGGEGGLVQREGVGEPPGGLVGVGEVVAAGESVGVVVAQDTYVRASLAQHLARPRVRHVLVDPSAQSDSGPAHVSAGVAAAQCVGLPARRCPSIRERRLRSIRRSH